MTSPPPAVVGSGQRQWNDEIGQAASDLLLAIDRRPLAGIVQMVTPVAAFHHRSLAAELVRHPVVASDHLFLSLSLL